MKVNLPQDSVASATVIEHTVNPKGVHMVSMLVEFPRCVAQELLRHRMFSFVAASSRAVPVKRTAGDDMRIFVPTFVGANQPGMVAKLEVTPTVKSDFQESVVGLAQLCKDFVSKFSEAGIHKQHVNRYIEPFSYTRIMVTGTEWNNFFKLRCHPDADPTMRALAEAMKSAYDTSKPRYLKAGDWHLPFITAEERRQFTSEVLVKVSAARSARLSYDKYGQGCSFADDIELFERLQRDCHMSPMEHQGQARNDRGFGRSNIRGFIQLRKTLPFDSYDDERKNIFQRFIAWLAVRTGSL